MFEMAEQSNNVLSIAWIVFHESLENIELLFACLVHGFIASQDLDSHLRVAFFAVASLDDRRENTFTQHTCDKIAAIQQLAMSKAYEKSNSERGEYMRCHDHLLDGKNTI